MIRIKYLYEECDNSLYPNWVTADEDNRMYTAEKFGIRGDAWATIFSIQLTDESPVLKATLGRFGFEHSTPLAETFQLRVCSPAFQETDQRFFYLGNHRALVQEEFDEKEVRDYCESKIVESSHLKGRALYKQLEIYFYAYDIYDD